MCKIQCIRSYMEEGNVRCKVQDAMCKMQCPRCNFQNPMCKMYNILVYSCVDPFALLQVESHKSQEWQPSALTAKLSMVVSALSVSDLVSSLTFVTSILKQFLIAKLSGAGWLQSQCITNRHLRHPEQFENGKFSIHRLK